MLKGPKARTSLGHAEHSNIQLAIVGIGMVAQFFAQIRSDPNPSNILSNIL